MNFHFYLGYESSNDKETTGRSTPRLQPSKRDQISGVAGRSNRFGFRQNTVRPASVGLTPRFNDYDNVNNNSGNTSITNTNSLSSNGSDKRRSKSASATSRTQPLPQPQQIQPIIKYNPKTTNLTYQQQQQHISHPTAVAQGAVKIQETINEQCSFIKTDLHTNSM